MEQQASNASNNAVPEKQSHSQNPINKKPAVTKKERDNSQKPIKQVIINHLR
jgi:hypothetical protein